MIRGGKKYKTCLLASRKKVQNVPHVLGLAVLFGVGECSGSKFGFPGPKFYGNPNLVSARSGRPGLVHYPIFPLWAVT